MSRLLIYGYGFIGAAFAEAAQMAGHSFIATIRSAERRLELEARGITTVPADNRQAMEKAITDADGILITPAPGDSGCPAFAAIGDMALADKWIGYLSTTGVYGDRDGGWVWEDSLCLPSSPEGRRRVVAERQWSSQGANIFRLPGLYGPGRNVIERLRDGTARHIVKPGHVFSRLHHDDCATALLASFERRTRDTFNLCDDEPAGADEVLAYAAGLTGLPLPPAIAWDDPALSPATRRFYVDNKRVANARAKARLGWQLRYPTYREGLSVLAEDVSSAATPNHQPSTKLTP